jgi:hypothetical protein
MAYLCVVRNTALLEAAMTRHQDSEQRCEVRAETANMVVSHQAQGDSAPSNTVVRNPAPDAAPAAAPAASIAYGTFRISR